MFIDYADFSDVVDDIYGGSNPRCSGHEEVNSMYPNGRIVWCEITQDCSEE